MIISHQLVTTLHLPSETVVVADVESLERESQVLAENEWQRIAADHNAGLKQSELAIKMNEKKVKLERAEMMPKVAIVAEEHFDNAVQATYTDYLLGMFRLHCPHPRFLPLRFPYTPPPFLHVAMEACGRGYKEIL